MSTEPEWMIWAKKEIGVKELTGQNDGKRVCQYDNIAGFTEIGKAFWCGAFIGAALKVAGCDMTGLNASARSFLSLPALIPPFCYGAVCVLKSARGPASGHVGLITGHTKDMVRLLGGNQNNAVNESWFLKGKIVGVGWPKHPKGYWPKPAGSLPILQSTVGDVSGRDA